MFQPSNGQKWARSPRRWRMKRSQGMPAWVDFAPQHVEMKDRFRAAGALLGQASPARIAGTGRAVADVSIAHETT